MKDYFKEQTEYEQIENELEATKHENEINEMRLELSDILDDVDLIELLHEYDYINWLKYDLFREAFELEVNIKEK